MRCISAGNFYGGRPRSDAVASPASSAVRRDAAPPPPPPPPVSVAAAPPREDADLKLPVVDADHRRPVTPEILVSAAGVVTAAAEPSQIAVRFFVSFFFWGGGGLD